MTAHTIVRPIITGIIKPRLVAIAVDNGCHPYADAKAIPQRLLRPATTAEVKADSFAT
ncbi:MAG: hypothetical protein ACR2NE_06250 [Pirellulales bacterium]